MKNFPVNPFYALEIVAELEDLITEELLKPSGYHLNMSNYVLFCGMTMDRFFDEWSLLDMLAIMMQLNSFRQDGGLDMVPYDYGDAISCTSKALRKISVTESVIDLVTSDAFSMAPVLARLARLPPPYDGLMAAVAWFQGTDNLFVDSVPEEVLNFGPHLPWNMETIQYMAEEFCQAIRDVFLPFNRLAQMMDCVPQMSQVLLEVALGLRQVEVEGDDLVFTDGEVSIPRLDDVIVTGQWNYDYVHAIPPDPSIIGTKEFYRDGVLVYP